MGSAYCAWNCRKSTGKLPNGPKFLACLLKSCHSKKAAALIKKRQAHLAKMAAIRNEAKHYHFCRLTKCLPKCGEKIPKIPKKKAAAKKGAKATKKATKAK